MKKHKKWIIGLTGVLLGAVMFFLQQQFSQQSAKVVQTKQTESTSSQKNDESQTDKDEYQKHVANFTPVTAAQASEKLSTSENFVIYIGRSTCPYCVRFVPVLSEVAQQLKVKVYYLNTENYEDDTQLQAFLKQHNISYVPTLLVYSKGQVSYPETPYTASDLEKLLTSYGYTH